MSTLGGKRAPAGRRVLASALSEMREILNSADKAARALTLATAATCLGSGAFYAVSAIYFSTVIGLSAAQIGVGLAFAGVAGIAGALVGGYTAAHFGSRRTLVAMLVVLGALISCYTLAGTMLTFTALASAISLVRYASTTARAALIASVHTGPERVRLRARLRVVSNSATGLGALLGGVALVIGTPAAFTVALVVVGALTASSAIPLVSPTARARLTDPTPPDPVPTTPVPVQVATEVAAPAAPGPVRSPFRDPRYLAIATLVGANATYFALLEIGLPLWITQATTAPAVLVSVVLVINTTVIILTQVAASRGTHDVRVAGRTALRGAGLIAAACLVFAFTGGVDLVAATVLLLVGALLMSGGEALGEAGAWGLTMELADPYNQPRYQGVVEMAYAAGQTVGPLLISATAIAHGTWGWLLLAAMYSLCGGGLYLLSRKGPAT
ncbi:MFS family permease [Actinokineospora baliensis]|uniref:MFS transporter n=1 Tax=Actinokineospora baliensis TaxID=547056 RepID=UPI00195AE3B8|nr:MFS transporter [Actinokineospora baliensis]MBM7774424.1 MFS family permease [Actinokineospora baliensis]